MGEMLYCGKRKDCKGKAWEIYLCDPADLFVDGVQYDALTCPLEREIRISYKQRRRFEPLLRHEWFHVECFALGVGGHSGATPLHDAIEAAACFRPLKKWPKWAKA
jgi:hypothetical protein